MSGLNHYAYASANPIRYTDPTGMDDENGGTWDNSEANAIAAASTNPGNTGSNPVTGDDVEYNGTKISAEEYAAIEKIVDDYYAQCYIDAEGYLNWMALGAGKIAGGKAGVGNASNYGQPLRDAYGNRILLASLYYDKVLEEIKSMISKYAGFQKNTSQLQVPKDSKDYHCDINSYNQAIKQGVNNPGKWDGNALTVNQIVQQNYADIVKDTPCSNTQGYIVFDWTNDKTFDHMGFYQNNGNYNIWDSDGIQNQIKYDGDSLLNYYDSRNENVNYGFIPLK